ncbi:MAG TPA: hypothetical protein VF198_11925 [Vicinamibacterales bacterium]
MPATRRRSTAGLLGLLFLLTTPLITPRIFASDEVQYFSYLRSIWFDGDVAFGNEYTYFHDRGIAVAHGFRETFLERRTETGRHINFGTIGSAILWAPFYFVGHVWASLSATHDADGYSLPYIAMVCIASALYGWLALVVSLRAGRLVLGYEPPLLPSAAAALAVWFGTPLAFYMYLSPVMAHATSAFATSLFLLVWLLVRRNWSVAGTAALGACAALMTMVREQDAFYVPLVAVDFALTFASTAAAPGTTGRPDRRQLLRAAAAGIAAGVLAFLPQALAYLSLNGRIGPSRLVARKMYWTSPHAIDVLASPQHGFLLWTPLALLAAAGLVLLIAAPERRGGADDQRRLGLLLALGAAGQVYVAGSVASWSAAGAFGQRRFVSLTPLLVIGLLVLFDRVRGRTRGLTLAAAALCVYWNLALMVQFGAGLMDRHRLDVPRAARVAFIELPVQLPELAYRFFFQRASFYAQRPGQP